jgi:hypothetical protein
MINEPVINEPGHTGPGSHRLRDKANQRTEQLKRFLADPLFTGAITIVVAVTLTLGLMNTFSNRELVQCIRDYSEADAVVTRAQAAIADEDRKLSKALQELHRSDNAALQDVINSFRANGPTPQTQAAQAKYVETILANNKRREEIYAQQAENEKERTEKPLPPPPSLTCR